MVKEQTERQPVTNSEARLTVGIGLNALYILNRFGQGGQNNASKLIRNGLEAIANMSDQELQVLIEIGKQKDKEE
jgi:hypothetical protein